jgi:hypothetical protein
MAVIVFGYEGGRAAPYRISTNELVNLPARWDAGWYLGIITDGYSLEPRNPTGLLVSGSFFSRPNVAFFPAYPLFVRLSGYMLGGTPASDVVGGVLVSIVAFFFALIYMNALAREMLPRRAARDALWMLATYPFAIFFGAMYTESLFLLGTTGAFFHFRRRQFARASLWGLMVGLTRPPGCFLSIPLMLLAVEGWRPPAARSTTDSRGANVPWQPIVAATTPALGVLMYSAFLWRRAGSPWAWVSGQVVWGRSYRGLMALIVDHYRVIATAGLRGYIESMPYDLLNGLGAAFGVAAAWPVARRLDVAYAVFMLANLLPPLAAGGLMSAGRFSAVLFPAFIWLAGALPGRYRVGLMTTFASIQSLVAVLFSTWRPLF